MLKIIETVDLISLCTFTLSNLSKDILWNYDKTLTTLLLEIYLFLIVCFLYYLACAFWLILEVLTFANFLDFLEISMGKAGLNASSDFNLKIVNFWLSFNEHQPDGYKPYAYLKRVYLEPQ